MYPVRVIFERGITIKLIGSDWHICNLSRGHTERINPNDVASRFRVRPIVLTEIVNEHKNERIDLLLNKNRQPFGLDITDFEQFAIHGGIGGLKAMNARYLLQNLEYHCTKLALSYASTCEKFSSSLPEGYQGNEMIFQEPEPYFEFESLVTTIRRTYDYFRFILSQNFGTSGQTPRNFHKTLKSYKEIMPQQLAERLETSWAKYGEETTSYRDCLIHYAPVIFGVGALYMKKLPKEIWSLNARIPDNPECRSQMQFVFDQQRDALTYGWDVTNEVLDIATTIAKMAEMPDEPETVEEGIGEGQS